MFSVLTIGVTLRDEEFKIQKPSTSYTVALGLQSCACSAPWPSPGGGLCLAQVVSWHLSQSLCVAMSAPAKFQASLAMGPKVTEVQRAGDA